MTATSDAVLIASFCGFFSSAAIIIFIVAAACVGRQRQHGGDEESHDIAHMHVRDRDNSNWNWALATSIISLIMCFLYGGNMVYCFDHCETDTQSIRALTGHSLTKINICSRIFQAGVIFLFLSHPLRNLPKSLRVRVVTWFAAALCAVLSGIGVIMKGRTWYYSVSMIAYLLALVMIGLITRLFYNALMSKITKTDDINNGGGTESQPMITEKEENEINYLSRQVVLLMWQSFGMGLDFGLQVALLVYHLTRHLGKHDKSNFGYYMSLAAQTVSLCFLIVLVNVCIWLSFEFAKNCYENCVCCCCACCHNWVRKKFKNKKMGGGTNIGTIPLTSRDHVPINSPSSTDNSNHYNSLNHTQQMYESGHTSSWSKGGILKKESM